MDSVTELVGIMESLLFSSGEPVGLAKLSEAAGVDERTAKSLLGRLSESYADPGRGLELIELNGKYQLCSKLSYRGNVMRLRKDLGGKVELSQASLEVLGIVAYNKGITKSAIERIRGVNSDSIVARLVDYELVEDAGRLESPGRPMRYRVTEHFLRTFGLTSFGDLPPFEMLEIYGGAKGADEGAGPDGEPEPDSGDDQGMEKGGGGQP